jgi:hypothetical protein
MIWTALQLCSPLAKTRRRKWSQSYPRNWCTYFKIRYFVVDYRWNLLLLCRRCCGVSARFLVPLVWLSTPCVRGRETQPHIFNMMTDWLINSLADFISLMFDVMPLRLIGLNFFLRWFFAWVFGCAQRWMKSSSVGHSPQTSKTRKQ